MRRYGQAILDCEEQIFEGSDPLIGFLTKIPEGENLGGSGKGPYLDRGFHPGLESTGVKLSLDAKRSHGFL